MQHRTIVFVKKNILVLENLLVFSFVSMINEDG